MRPQPIGAATVRERTAGFLIQHIERSGAVAVLLLLGLPLSASITGTVINGTTGAPQAAATVTLYKFGQGGMEPVTDTKTDAQGKFTIDQNTAGPGPAMLRVEIDNVTYNHMLPPGTPTTGITFDVYNAGRQPHDVKISKHMLLFQPSSGGPMTVDETFLVDNSGKTTWVDPVNGTVRFYLPAAAQGKVQANAAAPDGLPIPIPTGKTATPEVYDTKFEIKPGETRIDLAYTVPYTAGTAYAGKIPSHDENTYLVAPDGVTLAGAGLEDLGEEPRTHAHIFGLAGAAYRIKLTGAVAAPTAAEPAADSAADNQDSGGSQIQVILPRVNGKAPLIVGLALAILGLGFVLLYRAHVPAGKETNERGRG
ncbi:MAG: carboxypeptidase-like regulatory domain-containing protein [Bryobacteraceae bacterium]